MAASREGVEKVKSELDKYERKLLKHENKWNVASVVQRLSSHDQSRLLKASVAARTLTATLIPKLKGKIDIWLTKKEDRLLQDIFSDYEIIDNKVRLALEDFKKLESGNDKTKRTSRNDRDKALSLSIERSLKQRKESKAGPSGRGVSVSASIGQTSRCVETSLGAVSKAQVVTAGSSKSVKEQLKGGGDVNETVMDETGGFRSAEEEKRKFLEDLQETLTPEELNWLLHSKQAMKIIKEAEQEGKTDQKDGKTMTKVRDKVTKWIDDQHRRSGESGKGGTKEEYPGLKATAPPPIPIDTFLNFVESLPGEIRETVREQTDSLYAIGKDQIFTGKHLSDPGGRMVSMDKLRDEYRDDRFDASDYRIRVPDGLIDEEHLKWMKEQKVDDAVKRYFGSYKKGELPPLTGDLLDIIEVPGFMDRLPKTEPLQPSNEDPQELLEKYHIQRISLLKEPDFDFTEDADKM